MNVYLASLLGMGVVVALMVVAVKIADRYKREAPTKGVGENRRKRRHGR
ncbi:hypothetical protein PM10SUCC1_19940 [Propionigenium maris DSM 9537]|uniref:Uncharacterized protein n=1 Tax=Propionigenium maris DSM 9537 TaxID=1123000 RepID=A0A9W6LP08_9FUSO|nr:hypothetical protein [Propionigenium maris]GLI56480.1 hypothetical protein PM10SUCC1_19940 [Propionigenium maris DSM 9537]